MKPKQILTDKEKGLILALYEIGKTDKEIADIIKLPRKTFTDILRYNNLTATIKKDIANSKVELSLYGQALKGDVVACIFWLCNRKSVEWRHVQRIEHTGKDGEKLFDPLKKMTDKDIRERTDELIKEIESHDK